jgi:hypothetical protein
VENKAAAICVLSPHSVSIMRKKAVKNGFLYFLEYVSVSGLRMNIKSPTAIKMIPEPYLRISVGIMVVTQDPAAIAMPSTMKNAMSTPVRILRCFVVFEDSRRIEI